MNSIRHMIKRIVCTDPMSLEIILSVQAILFGLFLISPGDAFLHTQVYHGLSLIAPEEVWGAIYAAAGMFQLIALHLHRERCRAIGATFAMFMWLFVDLSAWVSNGESAATVTYFVFALIAMWAVIAISARDYSGCDA